MLKLWPTFGRDSEIDEERERQSQTEAVSRMERCNPDGTANEEIGCTNNANVERARKLSKKHGQARSGLTEASRAVNPARASKIPTIIPSRLATYCRDNALLTCGDLAN